MSDIDKVIEALRRSFLYQTNCELTEVQSKMLLDRIAELEASIDQLIKAGRAVTSVAEWRYANLTELLAWDTLVDNIYKERENEPQNTCY